MQLEKKRVTVVGLGQSGEAAAAFLARQGAIVSVIDDAKKEPPVALLTEKSRFPISFQMGDWNPKDLLSADLIVVSPGVPLSRLPMAALADAGIPVISEIELAFRFLMAPVIAITGTNGKSTTTTLVAEILKESGLNVFLGGNIGNPLIGAALQPFDYIVAEVSSFQLETIDTFRPRIAALLNITEDHMNRHKTMENYRAAKERIFENQTGVDYAVFNVNDPPPNASLLKGIPVWFAHKVLPGEPFSLRRREVALSHDVIISNIMGTPQPIIWSSALSLYGEPNMENVMAAIAISQLAGASQEAIWTTLTRFSGLPHRMEKVREIKGVTYIDDSKGTNVWAVRKSLEGMTRPVVLIAGGMNKGADFAPLREVVLKKVTQLILMGDAADVMARCFHDHPAVTRVGSMKEAVVRAAAVSGPNNVVLLSPGCASFDMFKNFAHRGDCFKEAVYELGE